MGDPVEDFFSSNSQDAPAAASSGDPTHAFLSSGGVDLPDEKPVAETPSSASPALQSGVGSRNFLMQEAGKAGLHELTGLGASIIGGAHGLWDVLIGKGSRQAAADVQQEQENRTYQPDSKVAQNMLAAQGSDFNPLNWPGIAVRKAGEGTYALTKSPFAATAVEVAGDAIPMLAGLRGGNKAFEPGQWDSAPASAAAAPAAETAAVPGKPFAEEVKAAPAAENATSHAAIERARTLQKVGLDQVRTSALTNDGPSAMAEFQTSKDPTTQLGREANRIFSQERSALQDFGQRIVEKTGGTAGTDGATLEARGNTILEPLDKLGEYYDKRIGELYSTAAERAQGQPVALTKFGQELRDASNITDPAHVTLKPAVEAFAKKTGLMDGDGNIVGNVEQAEVLRKYLGRAFTHQNSTFVRTLKDALDEDVTSAAGDDIYKEARALFAEKKNTLENPNGIGKLLDVSGPQGINRRVPTEKVADTLLSMPNAQLKHVVSVLESAPEEVQPQAQAALAELRAHVANRVLDAGNSTQTMWNNKAVTKLMNAQSGKLPIIFGGDAAPVLEDFKTLNDAGNILRVDRGYPGAAVQGNILKSRLLPGALSTAGATAGATVGGVVGFPGVGAAAGSAAGAALGSKMQSAAALKALRARQTTISELLKSTPP